MTLTFSQKVNYSIARFGTSIAINMTDLLTGFLYFKYFGLANSPFLAFLGVALGKIAIAFSSYFAGYFSDATKSRWGRRKPWIMFGAPFLALAYFFLFTPNLWLGGTGNIYVIFGYLLVFNTIFQALYGIVLTPYQSWLPEIATEKEWLEVSGYQNTVNLIAFTVGAGTAFLIPALITKNADGSVNFSDKMKVLPFSNGLFLLTVVSLFTLFIVIFFIPTLRISIKENFKPNPSIREELNVVLKNKNYVGWIISRGIFAITLSGLIGIMLVWVQDVLNFGTLNYIVFGLVVLVSVFLSIVFWVKYGNKHGKTQTYEYAIGSLIFILPFMSAIGFFNLGISPQLLGLVFGFLVSIGLGGYYVLPYAIIADIVLEDQIRTSDTSRAGLYYGFESFPLNIAQFLGYLLLGVLLSLPDSINFLGMVISITYSIGYLIFGPLSALFVIVSLIVFVKYVNADPSSAKPAKLIEEQL